MKDAENTAVSQSVTTAHRCTLDVQWFASVDEALGCTTVAQAQGTSPSRKGCFLFVIQSSEDGLSLRCFLNSLTPECELWGSCCMASSVVMDGTAS